MNSENDRKSVNVTSLGGGRDTPDENYGYDDDGKDDDVLFRYNSSERLEEKLIAESKSPSSPLVKGMQLDLSFTAASKKVRKGLDFKQNSDSAADGESYTDLEELPVQESSVTVVFDLPDGSQGENVFKLGHTVEVLKSFVESEYGIPMTDQQMYIEDKHMLDPLSLLDYPEAKGESEVFIRVEGPLPAESKK